ncbi:MAG: DUF1761 domain-containing protein [Actinomycetota bacterium]
MPDVTIDWVGVIVATLAAMVLGALWYGPLFGERWVALMGKSREELQANMGIGYGLALVGAFILSIVMTYVTQWGVAEGFGEGAVVGVVMWAGFVIATQVSGMVFEGRSWEFIMLVSGNSLLTFLIVGGIVASFN